ncbi:carboxypeptidase-like regulatory domain-containing protein [Reichenbachiella versicolor]|uniref:carboxypeptidase-like regulatory domain-containing protein n=1 Tax=Reichenbachiella versicolor TaxID=1821036 RepID=UPI0013A59175|nr:carboxypeptidase-like regulatory domain-containing protein [Reichenbachiella versicolor]
MNLRCIVIFTILSSPLMLIAQKITLKGNIADIESLENINAVHVYTSKGGSSTSDIDGNFLINVNHKDTVYLRHISYEEKFIVISDTSSNQSIILMLRQRTKKLNEVQVEGDREASETVLTLPQKNVDNIPGVRYPEKPYEPNYRLGVAGSIFHPATAIYRLTSKEYKQRKRHHKESQEQIKERQTYMKAYYNFYEALDLLKMGFDEYRMVDFLFYMGYSVEDAAATGANYQLYIDIPKKIDKYYNQLDVEKY